MGVAPSSNPTVLLAQIIQGEAATPADQFGVASTIYNRTIGASGYTGPGYGLSPFAAAVAPSQFSAYPNALATPNANAMSLATALQNGTLSSFGNTGNATFYNAPGYAYPSLSTNSYSPSSNAYSDGINQLPSSNFVLPQLGGATVAPSDLSAIYSPSDQSAIDAVADGSAFNDVTDEEIVGATPDAPGGDVLTSNGAGDVYSGDYTSTYSDPNTAFQTATSAPDVSGVPGGDVLTSNGAGDVYSGDYTSTYSDPNTAFQTATSAPDVSGVPGGANAPASGATSSGVPGGANAPASGATSSGATNSGSGTPIDVTDVTSAGSLAGNAVQSGLNSAASAVTSSTSSAISAGTGWLGSLFSASTNIFVRAGFVLLGIVVLFGAFLFFYMEQGGKPSDLMPRRL